MVELAVSLPMLVGLAMATIETCRFLYIKQSVKIAAYECARLAIVPGAVEEDVQDLMHCHLAESKTEKLYRGLRSIRPLNPVLWRCTSRHRRFATG